jgi:hypothetical protein
MPFALDSVSTVVPSNVLMVYLLKDSFYHVRFSLESPQRRESSSNRGAAG